MTSDIVKEYLRIKRSTDEISTEMGLAYSLIDEPANRIILDYETRIRMSERVRVIQWLIGEIEELDHYGGLTTLDTDRDRVVVVVVFSSLGSSVILLQIGHLPICSLFLYPTSKSAIHSS